MMLKGDIFLVNFGKGEGIRPAVIVQNNICNKNSTSVIVAAITSKAKKKFADPR